MFPDVSFSTSAMFSCAFVPNIFSETYMSNPSLIPQVAAKKTRCTAAKLRKQVKTCKSNSKTRHKNVPPYFALLHVPLVVPRRPRPRPWAQDLSWIQGVTSRESQEKKCSFKHTKCHPEEDWLIGKGLVTMISRFMVSWPTDRLSFVYGFPCLSMLKKNCPSSDHTLIRVEPHEAVAEVSRIGNV